MHNREGMENESIDYRFKEDCKEKIKNYLESDMYSTEQQKDYVGKCLLGES